jgi:hypothetical protein
MPRIDDIVSGPPILCFPLFRFACFVRGAADASVQLVCSGTVLATVTADDNGTFVISVQPTVLSSSLEVATALVTNKCKVVATTPLAACSVSPPGVTTLVAPLQLLGASTGGVVTIIGGLAVTTVGGILSCVAGVFSVV